MISSKNGNADVFIYENGKRKLIYNGKLKLEYPLNVDIRVQAGCSLATTICKDFCHEAPENKGRQADFNKLRNKLKELPSTTEIAIGCNYLSNELKDFIIKIGKKFIVNLTINIAHLAAYGDDILQLITDDYIQGLGISYRKNIGGKPFSCSSEFLKSANNSRSNLLRCVVLHVIAGIDDIDDILSLDKNKLGFELPSKLLILGEKDFGFNLGKVNEESESHKKWKSRWKELASKFDILAFDNLALEQLNVKDSIEEKTWELFNNGEESFYINAVDEYLSPSSRSLERHDYNQSFKDYFKFLKDKNKTITRL